MMHLGVYQTKSLGSAYVLLQETFSQEGLELVEFIPGAGGATLLLRGAEDPLRNLAIKAGADSRYAFHLLGEFSEPVLRALYSLETSSLKTHFAVIETEDSAELFRLAEVGLRAGDVLSELKLPRGMGHGKGCLILTGDDEKSLEALRIQVRSDARLTIIKNRSDKFDDLF